MGEVSAPAAGWVRYRSTAAVSRSTSIAAPIDPVAARWAEQNRHLFPVGNQSLDQPELDIDFLGDSGGAAGEPEEDMDIQLC